MPECNGICVTALDVGLPYSGVVYPHPDCPEHGHGYDLAPVPTDPEDDDSFWPTYARDMAEWRAMGDA